MIAKPRNHVYLQEVVEVYIKVNVLQNVQMNYSLKYLMIKVELVQNVILIVKPVLLMIKNVQVAKILKF